MGKHKLITNSTCDENKENRHAISRKRKAEIQIGSQAKMIWAENTEQTSVIYSDMGVHPLRDTNLSRENVIVITETTPDVPQQCTIKEPPPTLKGHHHRKHSSHCSTSNSKTGLSEAIDGNINSSVRDSNSRYPGSIHQNSQIDAVRSLRPFQHLLRNDDNFLCRRVKDVTEGKDHFHNLSDEMILCVFQWLPKFVLASCARVCKRWSRLVLDESLWKRIDLANKVIEPSVIGRVLSRGVHILRLTKTEIFSPLFDMPSSPSNSQRFYKVQYLDLSMAAVSTEALEELFSTCRDLKKISLENCQLSDTVCRNISENRKLEVLNLCMCQGISRDGASAIASNCRWLEALNLAWCNLSWPAVDCLCQNLTPNVVKLNLSGCRDAITDEDIDHLVKTCSHLKELDLSDATSLSCGSIYSIATFLIGLEYLALSRCYHIMPSTLPTLNSIVTLLAVDVFGMLRETSLQHLRESMSSIELNKFPFSSIARPTTGVRRTSLWGLRVREFV